MIRARAGVTIAQDPTTAVHPDMPANAIAAGVVDHVVPLEELARFLIELVALAPEVTSPPLPSETQTEIRMTESDPQVIESDQQPGEPSDFACPDCGGVLRRVKDGVQPKHFRCQVGHAWADEGQRAAKDEQVEAALWVALRSLAESAKLLRQSAQRARGHPERERRFRERAQEVDEHVRALRAALLDTNEEREGGRPSGGATSMRAEAARRDV